MDSRFLYIGSAPCGCVVDACVDDPAHKRDVAQSIAESVRAGLLVARIPNPGVSPFTRCEPHKGITDHAAWLEAIGLAPKPRKKRPTAASGDSEGGGRG